MIRVLTPSQMRDADQSAFETIGESALMQNAGNRVAAAALRYAGDGTIVAFAGPGNNGGDAFAACAAIRRSFAPRPCVIYANEERKISAARRDAESAAAAAGVERHPLAQSESDAASALHEAGLALDGLFGTSSRLPIGDPYRAIIRALNAADVPTLAIDIPSGIDALTGGVDEIVVRARATVTLAALKPGVLLDPARSSVGDLILAEIGITDAQLVAQVQGYATMDTDELLSLLPKRAPSADKRAAGAPFIIAGSQQFPGAAVLCARAAARAGAGYVTVATSSKAAPTLRAHLVEQVVTEIANHAQVEDAIEGLLDTAKHCSAVGIGPGLGLDGRTGEIVCGFLAKTELPFVADASALFHFAKHLDLLKTPRAVITPHAGEFARLSGRGTLRDEDRVSRLRDFVERTQCTTLLKGRTTLVYDGTTLHLNLSGTSALATAGTGDVLTGIIATLLSQGLAPVDAARAGAYWHGLAAQHCAKTRTRGVMAGDLPDAFADALSAAPESADLWLVFKA